MTEPSGARARGAASHWWRTIMIALLSLTALAACAWSWMAWRTAAAATEEQAALLARYQDVVTHQAAIEQSVKTFDSFLAGGTSEAATQQLLTLVEQAARQASVQLTGLKPLPPQRESSAVDYSVELDCSASMEALARFVHALEYGPALLRVHRLRINPDPRSQQLLDAQLLVTYTTLL